MLVQQNIYIYAGIDSREVPCGERARTRRRHIHTLRTVRPCGLVLMRCGHFSGAGNCCVSFHLEIFSSITGSGIRLWRTHLT